MGERFVNQPFDHYGNMAHSQFQYSQETSSEMKILAPVKAMNTLHRYRDQPQKDFVSESSHDNMIRMVQESKEEFDQVKQISKENWDIMLAKAQKREGDMRALYPRLLAEATEDELE